MTDQRTELSPEEKKFLSVLSSLMLNDKSRAQIMELARSSILDEVADIYKLITRTLSPDVEAEIKKMLSSSFGIIFGLYATTAHSNINEEAFPSLIKAWNAPVMFCKTTLEHDDEKEIYINQKSPFAKTNQEDTVYTL